MDLELVREMLNTGEPIKAYAFLSSEADGGVEIVELGDAAPQLKWRGKWAEGWHVVEPFYKNAQVYIFGYKQKDGTVAIDRIRDDLQGTEELWRGDWAKNWSQIKPFYTNGQAYTLAYMSGEGTVAIDRIRDDLQGTEELWRGDWAGNWGYIQPFYTEGGSFNGPVYLLLYKSDGTVAIDRIRDDLQGTEELWRGELGAHHDCITVFNLDGDVYVVFTADPGIEDAVCFIQRLKDDLKGIKGVWMGIIAQLEPCEVYYYDSKIYLLGLGIYYPTIGLNILRLKQDCAGFEEVSVGKYLTPATNIKPFYMIG